MVSLASLWAPIVISAILVFLVSSLIHMVLKYHNSDYKALPNEDAVREVIRNAKPEPREYIIPYCPDYKLMNSPEMQKKFAEGPLAVLTIKPAGSTAMGPTLVQWFIYSLFVSLVAGYVASRSVAAGTDYLHVFRITGTVAFMGYAGAQLQDSIWWGRPWSITIKNMFDGLIYGLLTAGTFGWRWPR